MKCAAALLFALGLVALPVSATLTLTLAPAAQNAARGTELVFTGTLTNTSATDKVWLNDIQASLQGSAATYVVLKTNDFFAHVPGILLPGETYTGPLFRLALSGIAPAGDYSATVALAGGTDVFGTATLASAALTVLSPDVTIVATDASASEFGPDSGTFTIARSGGTGTALPVSTVIAGTAINGTTYTTIQPAQTIPAGLAVATITITPTPDQLAQGDRSAILTLSSSAAFNLGGNTSATVTVHDLPADAWRWQNFGANANDPAAADAADWDADGIENLLEYALALDPKTADPGGLPAAVIEGDFLTFSFVPNSAALDLGYVVEGATDFTLWDAAVVEVVMVANPLPPNRVTMRYRYPVGVADRAFLRLSITRP